tara:strand:- start:2334 stop:2759 length:426 start_codon:yes stop_codon:yes gene_type:complete
MASGGKRFGAGRKNKYHISERMKIYEICREIGESRKFNCDYILVNLKVTSPDKNIIKVWQAKVKYKNKNAGFIIKKPPTPKSSINRLIQKGEMISKFSNKIFMRPKNRKECLVLSNYITSIVFPEKYHRISMIEKIWKNIT